MPEENTDTQEPTEDLTTQTLTTPDTTAEPSIEELVAQQVAEELKGVKGNLDKAYSARDDALAKIAEFELEQTKAETARLKEEGNHQEAFELEISQERAKIAALTEDNVKLTRDIEVKSMLSSYDFKSDSASSMAYNSLINDLQKNDKGEWVNKAGKQLVDHVSEFMTTENNSFLLKPVVNTGTGETHKQSNTQETSVFKMTQEEVLARVEKGEI